MKKIITKIIYKGHKSDRYLSVLKKHEFKSISYNKEVQKKKLFDILDYAVKNVPYYKNIALKNNICLKKENSFRDIRNFPILTKDILLKEFKNLKAANFNGKYHKNTSGGSTGEPAIFLQDEKYLNFGIASKTLFMEWTGWKPGDTLINLWGSERDILEGKKGLKSIVKENLMNTYLLNSFNMSEGNMRKYVKFINKKKPKVINTYVQSIYEFARFIKNNNLKVFSPKGIITSAGTLYPKMKELIESVFKTKVYNRYGSRESNAIACSCEKDEGLHLNVLHNYIEILNNKFEPCKAGEVGNVYVTTLSNYVMPLIRYNIGDLAVPAENEQCSCGRGLPLIKKVVGRSSSMIRTEKGIFDGTALTTCFYFFNSIKKYQLIQKKTDYIIIKVVIDNKDLWNNNKIELDSKLKRILGEDVKIDFEAVKEIKPTKSGKYLYIISEVKE